MPRYEVTNITKVKSSEDVMDARCAVIELVVPRIDDDVVLALSPRAARSVARMLNRHANFIDPTKRYRP